MIPTKVREAIELASFSSESDRIVVGEWLKGIRDITGNRLLYRSSLKPGWYWFDGKTNYLTSTYELSESWEELRTLGEIIEWNDGELIFCFEGEECPMDNLDGLWYGPLIPPWESNHGIE